MITNYDDFRKDFKHAINSIEMMYDIKLGLGTIHYDNIGFHVKLEGKFIPKDGKPIEQVEFEKYCRKYGLSKEDFGKRVLINGQIGLVCGINPKAKKYPILVKIGDKRYKIHQSTFQRSKEDHENYIS